MPLDKLPYNVVDQFTWTAAAKLQGELSMDPERRKLMHTLLEEARFARSEKNINAQRKAASEAICKDSTKQPEGFHENILLSVQNRTDALEEAYNLASIDSDVLYYAVRQTFFIEELIWEQAALCLDGTYVSLFSDEQYRGRQDVISKINADLEKVTQKLTSAKKTYETIVANFPQKR